MQPSDCEQFRSNVKNLKDVKARTTDAEQVTTISDVIGNLVYQMKEGGCPDVPKLSSPKRRH